MDNVYYCLFNLNDFRNGSRFDGVSDFQWYKDKDLVTTDLDGYIQYIYNNGPKSNRSFSTGFIGESSGLYFLYLLGYEITVKGINKLKPELSSLLLNDLSTNTKELVEFNGKNLEDIVIDNKLKKFINGI